MTAQEQLLQLSNESKAILEAAALLDEPFSVPLLVDLGFSPDGLDPLFDNGIFHESLVSSLRRAAEVGERTGSDLQTARQRLALASYLVSRIRLRDGLAALALAREAAERAQHVGLLSEIFGLEGFVLGMMGNHDEARARVDRSLELALNNGLPMQAATAYRFLADLRDFKADYGGARDAHLRAISFCRQKGTVSEEHMCFGCLGYALFRSGQWRKAIENSRKVLSEEDARPIARAAVAVVPAMIGVLRGERRQAKARLADALWQLRANSIVTLEFLVLWVNGVMADFEGNHPLAAEQYRELLSLWHETEDRMLAVPGVVSAAGFYVDRRDSANLAACSEILSVIAQENQNEETRAATQAILAETAWYHGDLTTAVDLMHEAVEGYDGVGTTLEMAFLRRRFALMLAAAGQPREAEEKRREASELARRLGLRPFLDLLTRDTSTAGPSLRESLFRPGPAVGLTPRQHSILSLIAKGITNKEVASHLNLSARTVEMHVALALERLNCRTRSEAVSRAMSLGLLGLKD